MRKTSLLPTLLGAALFTSCALPPNVPTAAEKKSGTLINQTNEKVKKVVKEKDDPTIHSVESSDFGPLIVEEKGQELQLHKLNELFATKEGVVDVNNLADEYYTAMTKAYDVFLEKNARDPDASATGYDTKTTEIGKGIIEKILPHYPRLKNLYPEAKYRSRNGSLATEPLYRILGVAPEQEIVKEFFRQNDILVKTNMEGPYRLFMERNLIEMQKIVNKKEISPSTLVQETLQKFPVFGKRFQKIADTTKINMMEVQDYAESHNARLVGGNVELLGRDTIFLSLSTIKKYAEFYKVSYEDTYRSMLTHETAHMLFKELYKDIFPLMTREQFHKAQNLTELKAHIFATDASEYKALSIWMMISNDEIASYKDTRIQILGRYMDEVASTAPGLFPDDFKELQEKILSLKHNYEEIAQMTIDFIKGRKAWKLAYAFLEESIKKIPVEATLQRAALAFDEEWTKLLDEVEKNPKSNAGAADHSVNLF